MSTSEVVESAWTSMETFLPDLKPDMTGIIKLERLHLKILGINYFVFFKGTRTNIYIYIYIYIRGSLNKSPDFLRMGTFIDSTHVKLVHFEVFSSGCNALDVPFQQLLEGPMEVLSCERVNDLRHSFFHLLNCLITTGITKSH